MVEHHHDCIRFAYSCFDRRLRNAVIPVLQQPASVVGVLKNQRQVPNLTPAYCKSVSADYHHFVQERAPQRDREIVAPAKDIRREDWVEPFDRRLPGRDGIAVLLQSRENARVAVSFPQRGNPIELLPRCVGPYYGYLQEADFGRMFLRLCPYFPFNARVCLNGHEWLACHLHREGISFPQCGNAFRTCANPARLQELADQFAVQDIVACAPRWLAQLVPFFTDRERRRQGFG